MFYLYSITTFNNADDIAVPMDQAPIVIENEPQITPDQAVEEIVISETPIETTTELLS